MKIILISGKQGSGKTTTANALIKEINKRKDSISHNMTFAEPLYKMHNFCWGYLKEHGIEMPFVKDGYLLQMLGTEWGRIRVDPNIWVKLLDARIKKMEENERHYSKRYYIISDCRFRNEFDYFKENVLKIRLACNAAVRKQRAEMWRDTEGHPSETDLDGYSQSGLFDLSFNTEFATVENIVNVILKS